MNKSIARFHYITQETAQYSHAQLAELACIGGADWIQLRVKNREYNEWKEIAHETKRVCDKFNAKLIINDNVHLAKEIGADGVHLGKSDMHPSEARVILGDDRIIGGTANTYDDVLRLYEAGVDYIGLGPYRYTTTKEKPSAILGIEGVRNILDFMSKRNEHKIPIIVVGGIALDCIEPLLETGAHGVAVAGAVSIADSPEDAAKEFVTRIYNYHLIEKVWNH